jgi:WD40 repeat protein
MAEDSKVRLLANNYDDEGKKISIKVSSTDPLKQGDIEEIYGMKDDFSKLTNSIKELKPVMIDTPFKGASLVMSQDERYFVFGSREGRLGVADRETKQVILDKDLKQKAIYSMAIIQNGRYILAGGAAGSIIKLNYPDLSEADRFEGHTDEINFVTVSKDETFMYSSSDDRTVRQWDLKAGSSAESKELFTHDSAVYCVDVSSDGLHVASASADYSVKVYSLESNEVVGHMAISNDYFWCVKISTKKKMIFGGTQGSIIFVWEFGTWKNLRKLTGHTSRVRNFDISYNDDILISAGLDHTIKIWDLKGFRKEITLKGHTDWVKFALLSKDQTHIFSCSDDCKVAAWKIPEFEKQLSFPHEHQFERLDSHNGIGYARVETGILGLSLVDASRKVFIDLSELDVVYYKFSADSKKVFVVIDRGNQEDQGDGVVLYGYSLKVFDSLSGHELFVSNYTTERVTATLILPNEQKIVFGHHVRVSVLDLETGKEYYKFRSHKETVTALACSRDSNVLISRDSENTVKMYNLAEKKETFIIEASGNVRFMEVSLDDDYLFLAYEDETLEVFSMKRRISIKKIKDFNSKKIHFLVDGKTISFHSENELCFMDLRNFQLITKLHFTNNINHFSISEDEELIMFTSGKSSTILPNPFHCKTFTIFGDSERNLEYVEYVCSLMTSKPEHKQEFDNWVVEPFHMNTVHLYAHFNHPEILKAAVLAHSPFYNSRTRHTPLEIAIEKKFMDCVESVYTASKERLEKEGDEHAFYYFGDSLVALNYSGYENLDEIYNYALLKSTDHSLPKFVDENIEIPLEINSNSPIVDPDEFPENTFVNEGTAIVFARSSFRISLNMGSQDSTDLLESLIACPNEDIYGTVMVQNILNSKWKVVKNFLIFQACVYAVYLSLLSIYSTVFYEDKLFFMFPLVLSCFMFIYEGMQIFYDGLEYLEDPWNYVDISRACLTFWYFADFYFSINYYQRETFIILVLLSWLRGISYFSIIGKTRYLIKLIIEATIDIGSFFVILFYSTVAFALTYQSLHRYNNPEGLEFWDYFLNAFKLNLGELNTEEAQGIMGWILFIIVSIINPVIMLNLLISIMGDTYGRVKEGKVVADARQLASMILEVEGIMGWKRLLNEKFYIKIVCEESYLTGISASLGDKIGEISEKVKEMIKKFETFRDETIQKVRDNKFEILNSLDR